MGKAFLFSALFHSLFFSIFRFSEKELPKGPEVLPPLWIEATFSPTAPAQSHKPSEWAYFSTQIPSTELPFIVELYDQDEITLKEKWPHTPYDPELENDLR
jgi:hypothetical protein